MNSGRILAIAANVFREVIRDRVLYLVGFYALFLLMANRLLPEIAAGTEKKILVDLGLASMSILGLLIAVFVGTGLINKEIEKRTVLVLIAKPISRTEFIVGKHLGLSAVLAVLVGLMTVLYLGLLEYTHTPYPLVSLLVAALYLFLQLILMTAVAIGFGVFTSSLLATLLSLSVYLMGSFSRNLVELGIRAKDPVIKAVTQGVYLVLPDLARLDLKNQAVYNLLPEPTTLLINGGYGLLYTLLVIALATLIFSTREF